MPCNKKLFSILLSMLFCWATPLSAITPQEHAIILSAINETYGSTTSMKQKSLYRKLALKLSPDKNDQDQKDFYTSVFQIINAKFNSSPELEITINEAKARIALNPKDTTPASKQTAPAQTHTHSTGHNPYNTYTAPKTPEKSSYSSYAAPKSSHAARQNSYTAPKTPKQSSYTSQPERRNNTQYSEEQNKGYAELLTVLATGIIAFIKWVFQEKTTEEKVKTQSQEPPIVMPSRPEKEAQITKLLPPNLAPENIKEILTELRKIKVSTPPRLKSEPEKIAYILQSSSYQAFAAQFNIDLESSKQIIALEMKFREEQKKGNAAADDLLIKTHKVKSARRTRILTGIAAALGATGLLACAQRTAQ
jgi:hypothetical protein